MKRRNLKAFTRKIHHETKDDEGSSTSYYDTEQKGQAIIWPASSGIQAMQYGERINRIMNMDYYGTIDINPLDMITVDGFEYKVLTVSKYTRHKKIEIELL